MDVASALKYLHFGYSNPLIHRDLRPGNVLLNESLVAHLSDFGIAKLLREEQSIKQTETLATIGYMAPATLSTKYGRERKVSTSGDVYSYGVMLMETFAGKKPTDEIFYGEMNLKHWVTEALHGSITEVLDTN
ncbi:hypothetical protein Patl1_10485 [Pistacia atlantica]|uniref:Uncharacterized protein n=1 Tax=Pistacia atlantica TaxID=434234 RepID=A0ACC1A5J6_9ROSI|nr:hypothetical protein Patl1_10485 [Pistacia atlantica]